jgi:hypothetical protein
MPGIVYRAVMKQEVNFTGVGTGSGVYTGAKGIDISQYREITLTARYHSVTNIPANCTVTISLRNDGPTSEDTADFIGTSDVISVAFTNADTAPAIKSAVYSGAGAQLMGAFCRVLITGANTGAASATFKPTISVDITCKS